MPTPSSRTGGLQVATPLLDPYQFFAAVTPSDTTVLVGVRALYIGSTTGGTDLVLTDQAGVDTTFTAVAGMVLKVSPTKVKAATTATDIVALS